MGWRTTVMVVALVVALLFVYTPRALAHRTWDRMYTRTYRVTGTTRGPTHPPPLTPATFFTLRYNHRETDGVLLLARLRDAPLPKRSLLPMPPHPVCRWKVRVTLREDDGVNESPFLRVVATVCGTALAMWKTDVVSTVLVSTRHKLEDPTEAGCFVRTARVPLKYELRANAQTLATLHRVAVDRVLAEAQAVDCVTQRLALMGTHFLFNKWMLDTIERPDGRTLRVVRGGKWTTLDALVRMRMPMSFKCVRESKKRNAWTLLAEPLHPTLL